MKAKEYAVLEMAIDEAVSYGYNRAHKHTDTPSEDAIVSAIQIAVMNSICEWFDFPETESE